MLISQTKPALPPAPPTKRVQMTEDELIAAMKADSKLVRKRMAQTQERTQAQIQVPENDILAYIAKNPGCTALDVATAFDRLPCVMRTRLSYMENRGQVAVKSKHVRRKGMVRFFYPVEASKPVKIVRPSPVRDKVVAFIRDNPGCTTIDVANHLGRKSQDVSRVITNARQIGAIRSERPKGGNQPAMHWVTE
jgi:DNA-binding MarR family transcriptional regulator